MLGADDEGAAARVLPVLQSFSKKVVRCGPTGSGHAVKAINNALNSAHLLLCAEGLLALQGVGVDPAVALEAINGSSGRSLQTEVRMPEEVLSRRFAYGFKLPLMAKDVSIARNMVTQNFPSSRLLVAAADMVKDAAAEEADDADYTRIVCRLERNAGREIRPREAAATPMPDAPAEKRHRSDAEAS